MRLQASAAVSVDGSEWYLINATPDVAAQLLSFPPLHPHEGIRHTPFRGVLLTDGELDHTLGLFQLREGGDWSAYATPSVRGMLANGLPLIPTLQNYSDVRVEDVPLDEWVAIGSDGPRLSARWIETGRGAPKYTGSSQEQPGAVTALILRDEETGRAAAFVPGVAELTDKLYDELSGVEAVWFDGTFWTEDEYPRVSDRPRTARDMGHVPISGSSGSAAWLARLPVPYKRYIHINNTNPVLDPTSEHRQHIRSLGLDLAEDGDELTV